MNKDVKSNVLEVLESDLKSLTNRRKTLITQNGDNEKIIKISRIIRDTIDSIKQIQYLEEDECNESSIILSKLKFEDVNMEIDQIIKKLEYKLLCGSELEVFIDTSEYRGIGKTTALINFAKRENCKILCKTHDKMTHLINKGFENVILVSKSRGLRFDIKYIVDEEFSLKELENLKKELNILTGFISQ